MLRYAITNRSLYPGDEEERQAVLLGQAVRWIADGIDVIQLREKDLPASIQVEVSRKILEEIDLAGSATKLLINSRPDVALVTRADGVHLASSRDGFTPNDVRKLYAVAKRGAPFLSVSCHTLSEVQRAREDRVDAILFAPVFEKRLPDDQVLPGRGLGLLREACIEAGKIPVYALGGVTLQNAGSCLEAGAAGIAGIRLFQST